MSDLRSGEALFAVAPEKRIWSCKIGEAVPLVKGADYPMRQAIRVIGAMLLWLSLLLTWRAYRETRP